jgi:hypothetical protein
MRGPLARVTAKSTTILSVEESFGMARVVEVETHSLLG